MARTANITAMRMTKRYRTFFPPGSTVMNYAEKATGRDCDICGHTPEKRPPKPGYPDVSEDMRLLRVQLPEGTDPNSVGIGKPDFTVTGRVIEVNVCADTQRCRENAMKMTDEAGRPKYDREALALFI